MTTIVKFPPLDPDDLGTDAGVMDDFSPVWGLVSGRDNLGRAYYRRLNTPAGGLFYDATYGYDVKDLLNADLTVADISSAKSGIKAQLMLDERTQSVDVVLTFDPTLSALDIAINAETNDGPFSLVLRATAVTLAILTIDGVPVPPDIAPDFIAADVADSAAAVVFPPSPPAVGALVGAVTINLNLTATPKQPVADSYLLFSGYADNSGLAQTHANRGATSDATFSQGIAYLPPACTLRALRLAPLTNTRTVTTTFTVFKNGVATGMQVSIVAGGTTAATDGHGVDVNGTTDTISLVSSGSPTGHISFGATIETGFVKVLKFAGTHSHDVSETCFLGDVTGLAAANANGYIPPACTVVGLRVAVSSNKSTTRPVDVTVYKNGSPTSMKITIPSGSVSSYIDVVGGHAVSFSGSDKLDLVSSRTGAGPLTDVQAFDASTGTGNWIKPADARTVEDWEYGGGGGGGSGSNIGSSGSGGDSRPGAGAGGGGGANHNIRDASLLPATVTCTPGAGGLAPLAGTFAAGTDGGDSSFGAFGTATGGRAGQPLSSALGGAGGAGGSGNAGTGGTGGSGGNSGANGGTGGTGTGLAAGGGGGGGGGQGGTGGIGGAGGASGTGAAGGAGGSTSGASGAAGTDGSGVGRTGGGGGGGAAPVTNIGTGGSGAAAAAYGAGGGGGSGASGTAPGGAGGIGKPGAIIVQTTILAGDVALTATLELT